MSIPFVILVKERPDMLKDMIKSIEQITDPSTYRLILVDNASESPDIKCYLKELESRYKVVWLPNNISIKGISHGLAGVKDRFFIVSDSDIQLNPNMPADWVTQFTRVLDFYPDIHKVGVALNIKFDSYRQIVKDIDHWEGKYWAHPVDLSPMLSAPCYSASIDSTLVMLRSDQYRVANGDIQYASHTFVPAIRVAGRFTAEHLGWDVYLKYVNDIRYYSTRCDMSVSGTTKYLLSTYPEIYA